MARPRVIVAGAYGRMGKSAVETFIENSDKFEIIAGVVRDLNNIDQNYKQFLNQNKVKLSTNLESVLHEGADILVELTTPDSVFDNSKLALKNGVRPVIGATGLSEDDIEELATLSKKNSLGAIIAPNFAIGAILMMKFSAEAAKYMDRYEIVETHHEKKLDSPSGTAIKTAKLIAKNAKTENKSPYNHEPARGQLFDGVPIHSLRLQGTVANQEVIFGGLGQTLKISHVTIDRSSFMPGILLAAEKVMDLENLVYGLENLLY